MPALLRLLKILNIQLGSKNDSFQSEPNIIPLNSLRFSLARLVMERTPHVLLAGESAKRFAQEQNVAIEPPGSLVSPSSLKALEKFKNDKIHLTEIASAKASGYLSVIIQKLIFVIYLESRRCRNGRCRSNR